MAFDGFVTKAVVNELNECLLNGKIVKVHQPNKDELIFDIYSNSSHYHLDICINSSNCKMHLTTQKKLNPITPSSFCMLLRKHLIGSKIKKIESIGFDRIIIFHLEGYNDLNDLVQKKLVIELMGKHSNVILLNEKDIIIDAIRHIVSDRNILPANPYYLLNSGKINLNEITFEDFYKIVIKDLSHFVNIISSTFYGFSKTLIENTIYKLNINLSNISNDDISNFYNYMINLISNIEQLKIECISITIHNKNDYVLISSENASDLKINTFLDYFYTSKEKNEYFENYRNNILKLILAHLKKYEKRLININKKLEECKDMEKFKLYGELITANLYRLNQLENVESICLENYYDNNRLLTIPLDKRYSPSINAKLFFKKYNKLKNALEIVSKQKIDTKAELEYIESIIYSLNSASDLQELDDIYLEIQDTILNRKITDKKTLKMKSQNSSPIHFNIDEYSIYVGRNNKQNDELTFKIANKNDLWFHAKDIPGSHVILKVNTNKEVPKNIIEKCASIAAYYSKAKASSKVEVQYTEVKNIKKPKNSKPGFVVFNTYHSTIVKPNNYET